jgi:hypothetical protein
MSVAVSNRKFRHPRHRHVIGSRGWFFLAFACLLAALCILAYIVQGELDSRSVSASALEIGQTASRGAVTLPPCGGGDVKGPSI